LLATSDLVNGIIPTSLAGVSVQINNKPAFVQYVSPTQINVLAPADASRGGVAVSVTNSAGTSTSATTMLSVLPGLAALSNYVRAVRSDGAVVNGTGNAETGYKTSAAIGPGDSLSLYGTGFGATPASLTDGLVFTGAYPTTEKITVTIGGMPADVSWAGLVAPGLYQINVTVPAALADGDQAVVASVAGSTSQSGAMLKVAASAKLAAVSATRRSFLVRAKAQPPLYNKPGIEHVAWIAGLTGIPQRIAVNVREGERDGCLQQIA
jgi:uncharacterized protein (TIGR03437 family)